MISTKQDRKIGRKIEYSALFAILAISFIVVGPTDTIAQDTNTTNATGASGGQGGQTIVVMPAGSVDHNSGVGYDPDPVTVSPGSTIIWDNQDNALHTATSGSGETATPDGVFDTGMVGANTQSQPTTMPTEPGEYPYFCVLHPYLTGTVIVES
jgi:plastocyanin